MARKSSRKTSTSAKKARTRAVAKPAARAPKAAKRGATKKASKKASKIAPKVAIKSPRSAQARPSKKVARRAGGAGKAAVQPGGGRRGRSQESLFTEGVERAMQGYLFDAISLFEDAIEVAPKGPLADDALFNIGAAYLRMRLVKDAEEAFTRLLSDYPESTIDAVFNAKEQGRTAAKALLGRMQARLAQGNVDGATADREALRGYGDSWVLDPGGARKSFHELAMAVMG